MTAASHLPFAQIDTRHPSATMRVLPLYPPPVNRAPPSLPTLPTRPSSLAQPFTNPEWTVSTHVFPAAFPRTRAGSTRRRGAPVVTRPTARMPKEEIGRASCRERVS